MTRVDFYVLQDDQLDARLQFVCRLIDKAMRRGNRVLVNVDDQASAEQLDDLLWSFRPESYIPHCLASAEDAEDVPVVIGTGADVSGHHDLLVNLSLELPTFFSRFKRCAEVVIQAQSVLESTRQHYQFLKQRGYPVVTHKL